MANVLIHAKVYPSMTIIQLPECIWFLRTSLPVMLLALSQHRAFVNVLHSIPYGDLINIVRNAG